MNRALLLLLSFGLLFGCGSPESTSSGDTAPGDMGDTSLPAAEDEIYRETTISATRPTDLLELWIVGRLPAGINPWRDQNILGTLLFPRAIRRNPETLQWEPWLAESWQIDEEGRFVEVTLREGFSWSDGRPITAADWTTPANRYFTDPGARSGFANATIYAGLDPSWTILGEHRFRVDVAHPTDRATLMSLLFLPTLPAGRAAIDELNDLWRFAAPEEPAGPEQLREASVSGGAYSIESVSREGETLSIRLRRREGYVDPAYGEAGARQVTVRFLSPAAYLAETEGQSPPQAHLIYLEPEAEGVAPAGYRTLSAGSDLTPAVLIFGKESVRAEELRGAARLGRDLFFEEAGAAAVFARSYPSMGATRAFGAGSRAAGPVAGSDQPTGPVSEEEAGTSEAGGAEESEQPPLRLLVQEGEEHRRYAEILIAAAAERGVRVEPVYLERESLAAELLTPGEWSAAVVAVREQPEPTLGDPLFGNLLPLTHRWELLVSRRLPRTAGAAPLTPTELADLDSAAAGPEGWEELLMRLWKTLATSSREAERQLAQSAIEELWRQREPWLYLYDEERLHFFRPGLGNLLFRHIPGADLGTVLPLLYLQRGEG